MPARLLLIAAIFASVLATAIASPAQAAIVTAYSPAMCDAGIGMAVGVATQDSQPAHDEDKPAR